MTSKTRVAVIYGGKSTEHSVSCVTAGAIMNNLDPQRYEIVPIAITREGTWTIGVTEGLEIKDGKLPEVEEADELTVSLNPQGAGQIHNVTRGTLHAEVDVAFPALHGVNGEDGTIQGVFEMAVVDEQFEVLVDFVGVLVHKLLESLARDVIHNDSPPAVDLGDLVEFGDIESGLLDARLIEGFVEDIGFGVVFVEEFDYVVPVAVHGLGVADGDDFVGFHIPLLICRSRR